jgi:molecular chaperone Hsp33
LFEAQPVAFYCTCTRDNVAQMLRMLGEEEVQSVLAERPVMEVNCEFCNHRYEFDKIDAAQIFSATGAVATSDIRH